MLDETVHIVARYERRKLNGVDDRNDLTQPARHMAHQEKERAFLRLLGRWSRAQRQSMRVLEIGCGYGDNLLQFIRWGFSPENLVGNELLEDRSEAARQLLPAKTQILRGDACELDLEEQSFDIVLQSTVFTSILNDDFQRRLASRMWSLVAPGGGVLWYDFAYNNPKNQDVRGVSSSRIKQLFPDATGTTQRITLAPPLARFVTKIHPSLYGTLNTIPFLRSHLYCWLEKSVSSNNLSKSA